MRTFWGPGWIVMLAACARMNAEAPDAAATAAGSSTLTSAQSSASGACATQRARLERDMSAALQQSATDPSITSSPDFTLALEAADGQRFVYSHGASSLDTRYESASTSKWVTAAVILDLVDQGVLSLDSQPSEWLPYWNVPGVTLARLLSFTSGFSLEPSCVNLPNADFAGCVHQAYDLNTPNDPVPGSRFEYSSTHLQVAGLMAIRAAGAASWAELFARWQARTRLFPTGVYNLPSSSNPRLAGGMHWTGSEYLDFLHAIQDGLLLESGTRAAMLDNQRGSATVDAAGSPVLDRLGQDWAYGFGNWLECPSALGPNTFDCGAQHRNSSPGAYGAYPFVDFDHDYVGMVARQGGVGTYPEGIALFGVVAEQAARWADACSGG
jgi:CubicO group peptidase (beta-lactamase class C family)